MKHYIYLLILLCTTSFLFAQQTDIVDFKTAKVDVVLRPTLKEIGVDVQYTFEIVNDTDSIYLDMQTLDTYKVYQQSFEGSSSYSDKKIILKSNFKKGEKHTVGLAAFTHPTKAMYFIDWNILGGKKQVWTQGQGKYTSNWLPSLDDTNDKIEFDLSITFDKRYEVIANGNLLKKESPNDSLTKWYFDMKKPMSSYLTAIAIGKYKKKVEMSKSGIPLEMYYYPEDEAKFEPTYRYTKRIFDFLEEEIGVAYPWQNYKQVPVKDFLYAGMENTSATLFSDSFVVDSIGFIDKNYVNVNAHELAHQWFGNLVTAKSGEHHWLQEGFATYYALLVEKEIFGDDYFYWKLYQSALQLQALNDGKGESLLNPNASSLTFYQKGAWVLHALRLKVGDKAFKNAVARYLNIYQFKSVDTDDFFNIMETESGQNLDSFVQTWMKNPQMPEPFYKPITSIKLEDIPENHFYSYLPSIQKVLVQLDILEKNAQNENYLGVVLQLPTNKPESMEFSFIDQKYMIQAIKELGKKEYPTRNDVLKGLLKVNSIKIRQAVAKYITTIPPELKTEYESLLNDDSYSTKEAALYNLWANFPADQKKYLDQTKNIQGFSDKSFRILWLTLAIVTKNYSGNNTPLYYQELSGYTDRSHHFEVRQNAFIYINELQSFSDKNIADLVNGALHHNWRFASFCRDLLDTIIQKPAFAPNLERVMKLLNEKEKAYLEKKMKV